MSTDETLLFGVLAVQADLIDAPAFAEACSAWAARKGTALADLLVERGWLTAEDQAAVDVLRKGERKAWEELWAGVAALLKKADGK